MNPERPSNLYHGPAAPPEPAFKPPVQAIPNPVADKPMASPAVPLTPPAPVQPLEGAQPPKQPRRKAPLIIGGIVAVATGVIIALILLGSSSAEGTVVTSHAGQQTEKKPETLTLNGQHFSLRYPSQYTSQTNKVTDTTALEQHRLIANTTYDKEMAITVRKLPGGSLESDSSYHLRTTFPDQYVVRSVKAGDQTAQVFGKPDKSEEVAFLTNGTQVISIAITTNRLDGAIAAELDRVVASFKWSN